MADDLLRQRVRRAIATGLGLDAATLPTPAVADDVEGWDSLGHMEVIDALSIEFARDIDYADAVRLLGEDAIVAWLRDDTGR